MDSEEVFWITFWKIAASVTVATILASSGCTISRDMQKRWLVEAGNDPITVGCLYDSYGAMQASCLFRQN